MLLPTVLGHIIGCRGGVFGDRTKFITGCLGMNQKQLKERDLGSWEGKKCGKINVKGEK